MGRAGRTALRTTAELAGATLEVDARACDVEVVKLEDDRDLPAVSDVYLTGRVVQQVAKQHHVRIEL